jgi:hypothetical protein
MEPVDSPGLLLSTETEDALISDRVVWILSSLRSSN